jgi:hypothetical protein
MPAPDQLRDSISFRFGILVSPIAASFRLEGVFEECTKIPLKEPVLRLLKSQTFSRRVWLCHIQPFLVHSVVPPQSVETPRLLARCPQRSRLWNAAKHVVHVYAGLFALS